MIHWVEKRQGKRLRLVLVVVDEVATETPWAAEKVRQERPPVLIVLLTVTCYEIDECYTHSKASALANLREVEVKAQEV